MSKILLYIYSFISNLFPTAIANNVDIKAFYIQVKEAYGKTLDDKLWIPFVWDTVYYLMCDQNDGENSQQCNF